MLRITNHSFGIILYYITAKYFSIIIMHKYCNYVAIAITTVYFMCLWLVYVLTEQIHSAFTSVGSQVLQVRYSRISSEWFFFSFYLPTKVFIGEVTFNWVKSSISYAAPVTCISCAVPAFPAEVVSSANTMNDVTMIIKCGVLLHKL